MIINESAFLWVFFASTVNELLDNLLSHIDIIAKLVDKGKIIQIFASSSEREYSAKELRLFSQVSIISSDMAVSFTA